MCLAQIWLHHINIFLVSLYDMIVIISHSFNKKKITDKTLCKSFNSHAKSFCTFPTRIGSTFRKMRRQTSCSLTLCFLLSFITRHVYSTVLRSPDLCSTTLSRCPVIVCEWESWLVSNHVCTSAALMFTELWTS